MHMHAHLMSQARTSNLDAGIKPKVRHLLQLLNTVRVIAAAAEHALNQDDELGSTD